MCSPLEWPPAAHRKWPWGLLAGCWIQVLLAVFPLWGRGALGFSPCGVCWWWLTLHRDPGLPASTHHAHFRTEGGYAMCGLNPELTSGPISSLLGHL